MADLVVGGGEELGGLRAVNAYMQRTAVQGSPNAMTQLVIVGRRVHHT